ncbi:energy-coupling factor transporter transmembrane component T family protein [Paenibacillus macquariensis]|uniref:Energy-coupling factor transport system permease protein n=1 Tax=Paenibacillus macquariensis TaxID=948756 RepID=A0ABY1JPW7_9BACL|nr:energy-coupling factor transporter transmembrane component T [Paenibacillus macquariensis]MEC0094084.1 energy-coupling factor transporter transmembrane component T [Paenibacillus macquariensis]OAB37544.1 cobalt transport family protein [Paenibacillus macquariensis subsp. macquariensis]SIQ55980.1 energy-coupling factor transport system permease protein [Paenibacillus macquariensis]
MANTVLLGQYWETNSLFHRLDPRTKIISIIIIMLSFLMLETFISYVVATILVLGMVLMSKIPFHIFRSGLRPVLFVLMFTFLYHVVFTKGNVIWSWSFIEITMEGLHNGILIVWRIILLILLSSMLTLTTQPLTLAHGLEKLLAPLSKLNVPVEQFSLMIVIAIRFIPTFVQELNRILLAQKARGYDITSLTLPKRIFAYIPMLIPLLFTIIQRAEQLTYAIDARAYGNGKGRTTFKQLKFQQMDYQLGGIVIIITLSLILLNIGGV